MATEQLSQLLYYYIIVENS